MIYITGDSHGDISHFNNSVFRKNKVKKPKKGDYLIICGDFGFIWDNSKKEKNNLNKLSKKKYNILFIAGTHENFNVLDKIEPKPYLGGMAKTITKNIKMLCNGYIFDIEDKKIFAFGGGESEDKQFKKESKTWYQQEMPSYEELALGKDILEKNEKKVDYIITHDAPTRIRNFINLENNQMNELHAFFDWIMKECKYSHWFFGKYHLDRRISPSVSAIFLKPVAITKRIRKKDLKRKPVKNKKQMKKSC